MRVETYLVTLSSNLMFSIFKSPLQKLAAEIEKASKNMNLPAELGFIERLMKVSKTDLRLHFHDFKLSVYDLYRSHLDNYVQVTNSQLPTLEAFSRWLTQEDKQGPHSVEDWAMVFLYNPSKMSPLQTIFVKMEHSPTIMDLSMEIEFMNQLRALSLEDIRSNLMEFQRCLRNLYTSHTDTIYEVTPETLPTLIEFSNWINSLGTIDGHNFEGQGEIFTADPSEPDSE